MENKFLVSIKNGILFGFGFLLTITIGVSAYQFIGYKNLDDVNLGEILTASGYNQLLANVRALRNDLDTLSGSIVSQQNVMTVPNYTGMETISMSKIDNNNWRGTAGKNGFASCYMYVHNSTTNQQFFTLNFIVNGMPVYGAEQTVFTHASSLRVLMPISAGDTITLNYHTSASGITSTNMTCTFIPAKIVEASN